MKRPEYLNPVDGPETGLSPKAEGLYKLLLRNHKDGVPAKMVGDDMLKELGNLVKKKRGKVRINAEYISRFYSDYIRKNIEEQPDLATGIVRSVFDDTEIHMKRYGGLAEGIFLGVLKGIQKPIKSGRDEIQIQISVYEKPRRFGIEVNTIVPAE